MLPKLHFFVKPNLLKQLQKQQYLDREDRAKKEFAALQSRRAGSSL